MLARIHQLLYLRLGIVVESEVDHVREVGHNGFQVGS
jgi:hypothetical protein